MQAFLHTAFGPRLPFASSPLTFPPDSAAALDLARQFDRAADADLAEGRHDQADRKAHLALELRCRALGGRA